VISTGGRTGDKSDGLAAAFLFLCENRSESTTHTLGRFARQLSVSMTNGAMTFYADLHVHSKYSRATSRDLDLEHLAWWAARKGIAVVGTGDCVHPLWLMEIKDKLVPAGRGLFRLKPDIEQRIWQTLPPTCRQVVYFMLSTEISTIYKKGHRTRKVHHLIYAPDLDAVDRLAARLARIGNIASDGRPILGLDSRNLLELTLETSPDCYLVPAHIWTPWFSALGSQSGFDSIEECYGDLAPHIFAVETGLSSDPAMNWRVSFLDRYRLTSNSDAHSPSKLGREATRFCCEPDYCAIRRALETGDGYEGTVEFFPEEGKYHLDGHRACGVRLDPKETLARDGRCPACGGRVTVGVAHRVELLADRSAVAAEPPPSAGAVSNLVPLHEILSEITRSSAASGTVSRVYDCATATLGPELAVLDEVPIEDISRVHPLLGEAVRRLRSGTVIRDAGYDGVYGIIRLFEDGELDRLVRGDMLFELPIHRRARAPRQHTNETPQAETAIHPAPAPTRSNEKGLLADLDADQARAATIVDGPLAIIAGPGSGKTRVLTCRIAHLVLERNVPAAACLAVTFTRRATEELRARLAVLMPRHGRDVAVHSFHSLGLTILRAHASALGLPAEFRVADEAERKAVLAAALEISESRASDLLRSISRLKRTGEAAGAEERAALAILSRAGRIQGWVDFDDLVVHAVDLLERDAEIAARWRARFSHILADEFQDVDGRQYRLLQLLAGPPGNLCVIGDPNQAIYGFRGADATCFARFAADYPAANTVRLVNNYRSTATIVAASAQVVGMPTGSIARELQDRIVVHVAEDEDAEADFVAASIEALLGGHDMLSAGRRTAVGRGTATSLSFADFAVLYRTDAQAIPLRRAFDRAGIPFKKSSPAAIGGHPGVRALLSALTADAAGSATSTVGLRDRLAAAAEIVRKDASVSAADLVAAHAWLTELSESDKVAGDEARLREQVALCTEVDFHDAGADRVSLMTMHAAKGLEFSVVFIVGMEDGLVPLIWGAADLPDDLDEERRLLYVAMTRAKDRLFLTRAAKRRWHGALRTLPPSRFLADVADVLVVRHALAVQKQPSLRQYSLF